MALEIDLVLIGTGVAPLVAAGHLISKGKRVVVLNPDSDFFQENSELPLDPLWPIQREVLNPQRLKENLPDDVLKLLSPHFPGTVELWTPYAAQTGFHDDHAPHVRGRSRLWIRSERSATHLEFSKAWEAVEDLYVEASDADLKPQILEGLRAARKFPGFSGQTHDGLRGVLLPKLCDVDVSRFRNGLLEFVRERLGRDRIYNGISHLMLTQSNLKFRVGSETQSINVNEGIQVFWTPKLTRWILELLTPVSRPKGVRLWEEWSLNSRDALDPTTVGVYEDLLVWAEMEGMPDIASSEHHRLSVLRAGPLVQLEELSGSAGGMNWASSQSFESIQRLCKEFLSWEKFSIRSMRPRAILEWDSHAPERIEGTAIQVIPASDGPLVGVARAAVQAAEAWA